ncbi:flagellar hook-associated protein FlgK [Teredinibacter turnerae T7901]|uniref:Flagellar hook-associated protein 1 n=1 Tax=Teredinibacter turnerae (strain ATCC 39867 / T7901) TaxID=377629 RepID=C5BRS7_TERTT|nr:flagellar hook-associated protein FlgK [Teredinibacter turnerae]ACR12422.1 flagellar hook-associated protein FlgK [Teredinibacter turnerae T7901]
MTSNLLGISITGLRAAQASLSTTGHNISNAGVEGYSRQRVNIETNPATFNGSHYIGSGANIQEIERFANDFVSEQLRQDSALAADMNIYYDYVRQLDNLLADTSTGLASGFESFFAAMQNGQDDPTSIPARQLILSESENLADRFNTLYDRFQTIENNVDEALKAAVAQVNALVANIAEFNLNIADATAIGNGAPPNDLLDKRDEALRQLAELVPIQTYEEGLNQINVVFGSGQNLVVGAKARELTLQPGDDNYARLDAVFKSEQGSEVVTDLVQGGEIGGLLRFRDETLQNVFNEFGRIALVMADSFNQAHKQGLTLENNFGENFFNDVNDPQIAARRVIGNSNNAMPNDRQMRLNIADSSQLTTSDYHVEIERGGVITVERLSDGKEVATGLMPGSFPFSLKFDGLELMFDGGTFQNGDNFLLQPTHTGGRDFGSALVNAESIAFGSPLVTDASISNQGNGVISAGEVLSLTDINGNALPLFGDDGTMNPPLIVRFNSPTSYDILDNSDPGNPVDLDPPIRNQRYVPGMSNPLFGTDPGATRVSANGEMTGLPIGRQPATQAALHMAPPIANAPNFAVQDFSGSANQFAFDVVVSGTADGAWDGTRTILVDGAAIADNNSLLAELNSQLQGSGVTAYLADNGSLAFRLDHAGYGDITLQNYASDPDGNGDNAPAGQASNLLGFNIEGATFTTVGGINGASGTGFMTNGYPAEAITITTAAEMAGGTPLTQSLFTHQNGSVKELASALNNIAGVSANAFNYMEISNLKLTQAAPLQLNINGSDLVEYETDPSGNPVLADAVPDPQTDSDAFNSYIADRINADPQLSAAGIYAQAAIDPITGQAELRVHSSEGDDLQFTLTAAAGESVDISDGDNPNIALTSAGNGIGTAMTVGGRLDVTLAEGMSLGTFPPESMIFGDTRVADFAKSAYVGIQAELAGIPDTGDTFTLDFNWDAASDSRNAMDLVNLATGKLVGGGVASLSESYGALVESVGIDAAAAKINAEAAEQVLSQTTQMRDSLSGVNLDEEAANLIRFEQLYSANTQVISVARDLFDRLINTF